MYTRATLVFVSFVACSTPAVLAQAGESAGHVNKKGVELDLRSAGRAIADQVAGSGNLLLADEVSPVPGQLVVPQIQFRGVNVQVNDPALDNIQIFDLFRPFVKFTQSETSLAAFGRNIVAAYNSSANQPLVQVSPGVLRFTQRFLSGFSSSTDGGQTWTSGFFPPVPGSIFTFGDPVVAVDRLGNFYFSGLGTNASSQFTIQVNKSRDGGRTWSDAVVVQQDNGSDKEWLAVGPDPNARNRDNVYVTWTSFQSTGAQLRFGKSIDGGATWTTKTIFAPAANLDPTKPQNFLQFSATYVDPVTGVLYVPFIHFSNSDVDFFRILISRDAGETFEQATFNVPGAPDPNVLPLVQSGELIDCRSGGFRLAIHSGPPQPGRFGFRSFMQATRMVSQPAFAARNGVLYLAWSNSTSPFFGDPASGSNVFFTRSDDGGKSWGSASQVNPTAAMNVHHVLPYLALGEDPQDVHIAYYTQHLDGTVDVDLANSHDRGNTFPANRTLRVSTASFTLSPSNITLSANTSTNFDRTIVPCYCLGEYMSVKAANGAVYALWGDTRNLVTEPVNPLDPLSGQTHSQPDVFFQKVMVP